MPPKMIVIAGPIASGKTTEFFRPASEDPDLDSFNVDDRCAALNGGSYQSLPPAVVEQARQECEEFIRRRIAAGRSFVVETTLRTGIALDQAADARRAGFATEMAYVTTTDPEINVQRAVKRQIRGGRDIEPDVIRQVYVHSLYQLRRALREFDIVMLFDNSEWRRPPSLQLQVVRGRVVEVGVAPKEWVRRAARACGLELARGPQRGRGTPTRGR